MLQRFKSQRCGILNESEYFTHADGSIAWKSGSAERSQRFKSLREHTLLLKWIKELGNGVTSTKTRAHEAMTKQIDPAKQQCAHDVTRSKKQCRTRERS